VSLAGALAYRRTTRLGLDPRTALAALVAVNAVCLGAGFDGLALWARCTMTSLTGVLLLAGRRAWLALACLGATGLGLGIEGAGLSWVDGALGLAVAASANLAARFVPVVLLAFHVLATTTVAQFMAALSRAKVPQAVIVPFAVVLRMLPVFAAEAAAVRDAMRSRGLRLGAAPPLALLEYRVVPLALRAIGIGDELSAAALTRGLGAPVGRTHLAAVGFGPADGLVAAWCAAGLTLWGLG